MRKEGLSSDVATALGTLTCLRNRHMQVGGVKPCGIRALGESIGQLQCLCALDLRNIERLKRELPELAKYIAACSTLKEFVLRGSDGTALIKNRPEGLERLKLISRSELLRHLTQYITKLEHLQEFHFVHPDIPTESFNPPRASISGSVR